MNLHFYTRLQSYKTRSKSSSARHFPLFSPSRCAVHTASDIVCNARPASSPSFFLLKDGSAKTLILADLDITQHWPSIRRAVIKTSSLFPSLSLSLSLSLTSRRGVGRIDSQPIRLTPGPPLPLLELPFFFSFQFYDPRVLWCASDRVGRQTCTMSGCTSSPDDAVGDALSPPRLPPTPRAFRFSKIFSDFCSRGLSHRVLYLKRPGRSINSQR